MPRTYISKPKTQQKNFPENVEQEIRRLHEAGFKQKDIIEQLKVTQYHVKRILDKQWYEKRLQQRKELHKKQGMI